MSHKTPRLFTPEMGVSLLPINLSLLPIDISTQTLLKSLENSKTPTLNPLKLLS
jgi:hypothetical protein